MTSPRILLLALALASTGLPLRAEFKLPKSVYPFSRLAEAVTEAETKKKSIGFLYTDTSSTCGLCQAASLAFVDELDSRAVMVYVSHSEFASLPRPLKQAISDDKGKYIPKLFVFSPDLSTLRASVNYDDYAAQGGKILREVRKALK